MKENRRIDFGLVKASVSMEMLIIHYGLCEIVRKGDEVRLKCPFHNGKSDNSMAIDLVKNRFYCFGCKSGGNVLDFVSKCENCSVREAALKLGEWFEMETPTDPEQIIASIEYQLALLRQLLLSR